MVAIVRLSASLIILIVVFVARARAIPVSEWNRAPVCREKTTTGAGQVSINRRLERGSSCEDVDDAIVRYRKSRDRGRAAIIPIVLVGVIVFGPLVWAHEALGDAGASWGFGIYYLYAAIPILVLLILAAALGLLAIQHRSVAVDSSPGGLPPVAARVLVNRDSMWHWKRVRLLASTGILVVFDMRSMQVVLPHLAGSQISSVSLCSALPEFKAPSRSHLLGVAPSGTADTCYVFALSMHTLKEITMRLKGLTRR